MATGYETQSNEGNLFDGHEDGPGAAELKRLQWETTRLQSELEAARAKITFLERQAGSFQELIEASLSYSSKIKDEAEKQAWLLLEEARQERERISREWEALSHEKEQAASEKEVLSLERDRLLAEKAEISRDLLEIGQEKESLWREITSLVAEREETHRELNETLRQLANVKQQQVYLTEAKEQLAADIDALGGRLSAIRSAIEETIEIGGPPPQGGASVGAFSDVSDSSGPSSPVPGLLSEGTGTEESAEPVEASAEREPDGPEFTSVPDPPPPESSPQRLPAAPEPSEREGDSGGEKGEGGGIRRIFPWLRSLVYSPLSLFLGYLAALLGAEFLTLTAGSFAGLKSHGVLLLVLLLHSALIWNRPNRQLLTCLAFIPVARLLSISVFPFVFPETYWYMVMSIPLITTAFLTARVMGWSMDRVSMNLRALPLQATVALSGLAFGFVEYEALRPEPLIQPANWRAFIIPAFMLLICTGFNEQRIYRGIMKKAAIKAAGALVGLLVVAAVFAVPHLGYEATVDFGFVVAVGLFFGWVALKTRSIVGTTTAPGITNIALMLVTPLIPLASLFFPGDQLLLPLGWSSSPAAALASTAGQIAGQSAAIQDGIPTPNQLATQTPTQTAEQAPTQAPMLEQVNDEIVLALTPTATPAASEVDAERTLEEADVALRIGLATVEIPIDDILAKSTPEDGGSQQLADDAGGHASTPDLTTPIATLPPPAPVAVIAVPSTSVHSSARSSSSAVFVARAGQEYEIVGRNTRGNWLLIRRSDGRQGWLPAANATINGDVTQAPVAQ